MSVRSSRRARGLVVLVAGAMLGSACVWSTPAGSFQPRSQFDTQCCYSASDTSAQVSGDGSHVLFRRTTQFIAYEGEDSSSSSSFRLETRSGGVVASGGASSAVVDAAATRVAYARERSSSDPVSDVYVLDVATGVTTLISADPAGGTADGSSYSPAISADGNVVVFSSAATNLLAGPGTSTADVYRHDLTTRTTALVSTASGGAADGDSTSPDVSADGSVVAFTSAATNLVPGDSNGKLDVFVSDAGGTISKRSNAVAAGGGDGDSLGPLLSGDGSTVTFTSRANNLIANDVSTSVNPDVFVAGPSGVAELVSIGLDGQQLLSSSKHPLPAGISYDGSIVLFTSTAPASNPFFGLRDALLRDRDLAITKLTSTDNLGRPQPQPAFPSLTDDGRYVLLSTFVPDSIGSEGYQGTLRFRLQTAQEPKITQMAPSSVSRGATAPVTITGSGFYPGVVLEAWLINNGTDGFLFSNVVVVDRSTITADMTVPADAALSQHKVVVKVPHNPVVATGTAAVNFCVCLTVQP